jgi:signal transduction histidine kinase
MQQETDLTLACLIHDLNNMFQTLVEAGDVLSSDPRWAPLAATILRSVERGKSITASLQSGGDSGAPLETIVEHAISFVEDSLSASGAAPIRFICRLDPEIELRRNWAWERVFINLFTNAQRAMPEGGVIEVHARQIGERIEITVRDEGPGIPAEILDEIFRPHVTTRASGGGLGLHIVETIVKQNDGRVRAANRRDRRGAEFIITLPAAIAKPLHALPFHAGLTSAG